MLVKNDILDYLANHYGTCDRDTSQRNDCYWGKEGHWDGCLRLEWLGVRCKHWHPLPPEQLDELAGYFNDRPH